jgi:hypothetical protein
MITLFMSCNKKTNTDMIDNENIQRADYIMNTELSSSDYSSIEGYFPKEGFVSTAEIAFQIAEPILNSIFGKEHIENEKPFSVNLENNVWIIEGTSYSRKGGVAYIEIKKSNGEILKVYHGK